MESHETPSLRMGDFSNSRECSVGFQYPEDPEDQAAPADHSAETLEFARRLVSYIRGQDRARMTVDCLYLALGDADLESETMTTVANRHGVTKAAISKRVKKVRGDLHLPLSLNNKSSHASHRYAQSNRSPLRLDRRVGKQPQPKAPSGRG